MDGLEDDDMPEPHHISDDIVLPEKIPRPSSAPVLGDGSKAPGNKPDQRKDVFFNKRGSAKASTAAVLENAVKAFEKIASAPPPALSIQETPADAFCAMLNARSSRINEESRHKCENEIMKVCYLTIRQ